MGVPVVTSRVAAGGVDAARPRALSRRVDAPTNTPRRSCASLDDPARAAAPRRAPDARACCRITPGTRRCSASTASSSAASRIGAAHARRASARTDRTLHEHQHLRPGLRRRGVARVPGARRPSRHRRRRRPGQARPDRGGQDAGRRGGHGRADGATWSRSGRVSVTRDARDAVLATERVAGLRRHAVGAERQPGPVGDAAPRRKTSARRCATSTRSHVFVFRSTARARHGRGRAAPDHRSRVRQEGRRRLPRVLPARVPARGLVDPRLRQAAVHDRRRQRAERRSTRCARCSATCRASSTRRRSAPRRWSSTAATTSTR